MLAFVLPFILSLTFIALIPNLGISIASFIVAGQNVNTTCDGSFMPLPTWLFVNAAVEMALCAVIVMIIVILIVLIFKVDDEQTLAVSVGSIAFAYVFVILLFTFFLVAWNIVGAVALFRDSMPCLHNSPVWPMTLASLIFQWLSLLGNWFSNRKSKKPE